MAGGLDDFLGEPEPTQAAPEPADDPPVADPAPEPVEAEAEPDPIPAADPPADDAPADPPAAPEPGMVPLAALAAERKARQDHKAEAATLRGRLEELEKQLAATVEVQKRAAAAPPPPPPPGPEQDAATPADDPMPDPTADPRGYAIWLDRADWNRELNRSERRVRRKYADLDEKLATFKAAAQENPALYANLRRQDEPYEYVYETAKRLQALSEMERDPDAYRARTEADLRSKVEAELREKVEAELRAKFEAERETVPVPVVVAARPAPALPPASIAAARSAAPRTTPVWNGPPDFDEFLPNGRKRG